MLSEGVGVDVGEGEGKDERVLREGEGEGEMQDGSWGGAGLSTVFSHVSMRRW